MSLSFPLSTEAQRAQTAAWSRHEAVCQVDTLSLLSHVHATSALNGVVTPLSLHRYTLSEAFFCDIDVK